MCRAPLESQLARGAVSQGGSLDALHILGGGWGTWRMVWVGVLKMSQYCSANVTYFREADFN